jgi:hypothetical protein
MCCCMLLLFLYVMFFSYLFFADLIVGRALRARPF